jgi:hypothetical protein
MQPLRTLRFALGLYRCLVCRRWQWLHTVRQTARCETAPLLFVITEAGLAALAELERGGGDAAGKLLEVETH